MARTCGPISANKVFRSFASPSRCTLKAARPFTMVDFAGPTRRISMSELAIGAPLHHHGHGIFQVALERRKQFGTERAVDHAMIAGERHRHHAREGDVSIVLLD